MYIYILLVGDHDEVGNYVPTINKQWSQQTTEQKKVIQEEVSPEVSKLKHVEMKKIRRSNAVFSSKNTRKRKWIQNTPCQPIISVDGLWCKME